MSHMTINVSINYPQKDTHFHNIFIVFKSLNNLLPLLKLLTLKSNSQGWPVYK